VPRDYVRGSFVAAAERIGAPAPGLAAAFGFAPPAALDPADQTPGGGAWWRWFEAAERALHELGVPYVLVDDEGPLAADVPLLLAPTLADCPRATSDRLRAQLARGAAVLCGPVAPVRELVGGASLTAAPLPAPLAQPTVDALAAALGDAHVRPPAERVERLPLLDASGECVGLALVNRSHRDVPVGVALEGWSPPGRPRGRERTTKNEERSTVPWSDFDEPGAAHAVGTLAAGALRLLVPAPRRGGAS
jgi:hypothetical protein